MSVRAALAMLLAFSLPGAGHLYLGRRARGAAFFFIVLFIFVLGLAVDGGIYTTAGSGGSVLRLLASYASMGAGSLYFVARELGPFGDVTAATWEYGTTFTLTAGLMNLLLVLDCYDIARGRKS
ncbi:MAG TPA: DUF6677 family protein [Thermoanaerobaculia bacterium]